MSSQSIIGFYGHKPGIAYCEFSNFFCNGDAFEFIIPAILLEGKTGFPERVVCEFSEKAIMCCKAALMGDVVTFHKIAAQRDPYKVKKLGREVEPWDEVAWAAHIEDIAFEAVFQKFASNRRLTEVLLSTGSSIIAEASRGDSIWGIGLSVDDPDVKRPGKWRGRNILGYALMEARNAFAAGERCRQRVRRHCGET
jgi:hypothetical protein